MVKYSLNSLNKTCIFGINIIISKFLFNDSFHKSKITKIKKSIDAKSTWTFF